MPDNDRVDLSADLDRMKDEFLEHMEAAAEEVKQQLARQSAIIAGAVGAVVILLVSYWVVFGRSDANNTAANQTSYPSTKVRIADPVKTPSSTPNKTGARVPAAPVRQRHDSQVVEHPSDEYEQPGQDSGM